MIYDMIHEYMYRYSTAADLGRRVREAGGHQAGAIGAARASGELGLL